MAAREMKRTLRLKNALLSSRYEICIERMKYFTEAYRDNPQDPPIIKRAKAVAHTLQNMTLFIREDELLVGNETSKNLGEKVNLDLHRFNNFDQESTFEELSGRNPQPFFIDENDMKSLMEMNPYWKGRSLADDMIHEELLHKNLISDQGMFASARSNNQHSHQMSPGPRSRFAPFA